jgi:hypothetical protein
MSNDEYKFLGTTMDNVSIAYGIFLIIWGTSISWISISESITSWIPAIIGFPIFLFGLIARFKPKKKKLFMHFAVLFGLIAFLGGLDFLRSISSDLGPFSNLYADTSKLMLLLSGGLFVFLCVNSFKFARRKNNESESPEIEL